MKLVRAVYSIKGGKRNYVAYFKAPVYLPGCTILHEKEEDVQIDKECYFDGNNQLRRHRTEFAPCILITIDGGRISDIKTTTPELEITVIDNDQARGLEMVYYRSSGDEQITETEYETEIENVGKEDTVTEESNGDH